MFHTLPLSSGRMQPAMLAEALPVVFVQLPRKPLAEERFYGSGLRRSMIRAGCIVGRRAEGLRPLEGIGSGESAGKPSSRQKG